jgi:hypothetical protein
MRTFLERLIPRQPGYPIEVAIGTGEPGQAVRLHDRHDQGVVAEESGLPAQPRAFRGQGDGDRQDLDAALQDALNGLVESRELLHLGRMLSEPPRDPRPGPGEGADRLHGHDPVGHLGQDVRGRQALDFLVLDALKQPAASRAVLRIRDEVLTLPRLKSWDSQFSDHGLACQVLHDLPERFVLANDVRACPALRASNPGRLTTSRDDPLPSLVIARANVLGFGRCFTVGPNFPTNRLTSHMPKNDAMIPGPMGDRKGQPSTTRLHPTPEGRGLSARFL